jgi:single-strand DNA-binding protein
MANYNRIVLVGNLTRDPQYKVLPSSQMPVADFGLAVNHKYTTKSGESREEVLFIDCTAFGKQADTINKWCRKGKQLLVEGRLKLDTWEDKQGGGKRSKHTVVIDNFQFLGGRDDAPSGGGGGSSGGYDAGDSYDTGRSSAPPPPRAPQPQRPPPQAAAEPPFGDEQQFKEDDIPF